MVSARNIVNIISLSRIPLAILFVLTFQRNPALYWLSVAACVAAAFTDIADGHLARKLGIASIPGRMWDSLGDKSFYLAVIVAFSTQAMLDPLVSWALLAREVGLYITRILYIENLPMVECIRPSTNWHGYFMYALILLGLAEMYGEIVGWSMRLIPFIESSAYLALLCGLISIVHYIRLK